MSAKSNAPIIIKRKKVIAGGGHHGGAWKVAYADFVTAMMAFFMLMWLLNATTEKQRKGIADYFSPTIPVHRTSGGGDGSFGGDSVFTEETFSQNGTGATAANPTESSQARGENTPAMADQATALEQARLRDIENLLSGSGGESFTLENPMRHVLTRMTDEGLIVEIFDLEGEPLFYPGTDVPTQTLQNVVEVVSEVFELVVNDIAVKGYIQAHPIVMVDNPVWDLSSSRADQVRLVLQSFGTPDARFQRVAGFADRKPAVQNPMSQRNNRIEIVLLRSDQ